MILPNLTSASLISLGQLCDNKCNILLTEEDLYVLKNNQLILKGTWNHTNNLWDIPIQKTNITENNYLTPTTHAALYHQPQNNPPPNTPKQKNPTKRIQVNTPPNNINSISMHKNNKSVQNHHLLTT